MRESIMTKERIVLRADPKDIKRFFGIDVKDINTEKLNQKQNEEVVSVEQIITTNSDEVPQITQIEVQPNEFESQDDVLETNVLEGKETESVEQTEKPKKGGRKKKEVE